MHKLRLFLLFLFVSALGCSRSPDAVGEADRPGGERVYSFTKGALLSTDYSSFKDLKKVIEIEYFEVVPNSWRLFNKKSMVRIHHFSNGRKVSSVMKSGISDLDITKAWTGGFWSRVRLGLSSPYLVIHRKDLLRIFNLARRRGTVFGEGDVAFYDFAETMVYNISDADIALVNSEALSEKGYINTFNHTTAQAFMTSIFSEKFADFIADVHERGNMPELITGKFTEAQLMDLEKGPTDNYVDMINNEWGQELGKLLQKKYHISRRTIWTPELLVDYLNDLQAYYSWAFQIAFEPFKVEDQVVIKFSKKLNMVMGGNAKLN